MPLQKDLYPDNWEQISLEIRSAAGWRCQHCGRPCRRPGQEWSDFVTNQLNGANGENVERSQRFTLTVAHLDQNPQNNHPENLRALCAPCHLKYDAPFAWQNRRRKQYYQNEKNGQLSLFRKCHRHKV